MRFVILGSGPAGYAAASTAAALGAEVTIVDRMALGGNWTMTDGIPSKTLLQVASSMAEIERAESRGVVFEHGRPHVDLLRAEAHARFIGQHQSRGVRERLDLIEATIIYGQGAVESDGVLVVTTERGPRTLEYDHLLVCTGAAPWEPPFAQVDHQRVLNTRDVLGLHALPEQLLVVGAGATGCEFAEFFQSCGSRVTLLSSRPQILPSEDRDVADVVHEAFLERGMAIELGARASDVERDRRHACTCAPEDGREFNGTPRDHLHGHARAHRGARPRVGRRRGRPARRDRRSTAAAARRTSASRPRATSPAAGCWPRRRPCRAASRRSRRSGARSTR